MRALNLAAWAILICLFAVDPQAGPVNWGAWCLIFFAAGLIAWVTSGICHDAENKKSPARAGNADKGQKGKGCHLCLYPTTKRGDLQDGRTCK